MIPDPTWSSEQWSQEADRQIAAHDAWKLAEHRKSFAKSLIPVCQGQEPPPVRFIDREAHFTPSGRWWPPTNVAVPQTCRKVFVKFLCRTGDMEEWEF